MHRDGVRFCPHCGRAAGADAAYCSACGASLAPAPTPAPAPSVVAPPAADVYAEASRGFVPPQSAAVPPAGASTATVAIGVVAILLNVLLWPGLGSLVAGRKVGWAQGFLFLFSLPLMLVLIGFPLALAAWIWALVTGIEVLTEANRAEQARNAVAYAPR